MNRTIMSAAEADKEEILVLYKSQIGQEYCAWDDHYPDLPEIDMDLSYDSLFVMKRDNGEIIAAISIDHDEQVEKLDCWDPNLAPGGELARLAVKTAYQNQGIARQMMLYAMERLKERNYHSVHYLVNKYNDKALRSYRHLGLDEVGTCELYEQEFICFEKPL